MDNQGSNNNYNNGNSNGGNNGDGGKGNHNGQILMAFILISLIALSLKFPEPVSSLAHGEDTKPLHLPEQR